MFNQWKIKQLYLSLFANFKITFKLTPYIIFLFSPFLLVSLYLYPYLNKLNWNIMISINMFGMGLFLLSLFTLLFCLLILDLKFFKLTKNYAILNILFIVCLVVLFFTNNWIIFFLSYESLLILSIWLTYFTSPNVRSKHVTFYFFFWTQFGSFCIFLIILFLLNKSSNYTFNNFYLIHFSTTELQLIQFIIFIGFGIKIPIWPFHFWLTKTHVEANTSFSIFLSGILVKTALFGLWKFQFFFLNFNYLYFLITFIGICDATLKIFIQIDLKKIVAYCTIFEMNIIMINFFFQSYSNILFLLYFCILHTILSFFFFFTVDCIYKRFNSRSVFNISNISNTYPNLATFIVLGVLFFNGLPLTLKFNLEIIFFLKLLNFSFLYFSLFILIQIIMAIFFTKIFLGLLFNSTPVELKTVDLTYKEIGIYIMLIIFLLFFSFF